MARKVILDVDPGIDDAVALTMALFDPRLDVLAVTATAGNVSSEAATRNVQAIIEHLDPPRWPRIGAAPGDFEVAATGMHLNGPDGLGGANFAVADLHHQHSSEKVLADELRAAPDTVTVIALGPLTNVARAFRRDPTLPAQVGHLIMAGGTVTASGNITPAAEYNFFCNPMAARDVFQSRATMTLIPLDVARSVVMTFDLFDQLPSEETRAGSLLRKILPHAFRAHRHHLGLEGIYLHDAVAIVAALHPEFFSTELMAGDVETAGELTAGATIFDRRNPSEWRRNLEVAVRVDQQAILKCIVDSLARAGERS
ncbi:MAG: nucleoside hydrolase [Pirellulales bacterium]